MAKVCAYTGKKPSTGHNVSHSNRKTKRRFEPNLQWKTLTCPDTGRKFRARLSTNAIKTFSKNVSKLRAFAREQLS